MGRKIQDIERHLETLRAAVGSGVAASLPPQSTPAANVEKRRPGRPKKVQGIRAVSLEHSRSFSAPSAPSPQPSMRAIAAIRANQGIAASINAARAAVKKEVAGRTITTLSSLNPSIGTLENRLAMRETRPSRRVAEKSSLGQSGFGGRVLCFAVTPHRRGPFQEEERNMFTRMLTPRGRSCSRCPMVDRSVLRKMERTAFRSLRSRHELESSHH
jgi:hypothetical protein